jgi:hypothetical protein
MTPEQQIIAIAEACGWTECVFVESIGLAKGRPGKNTPSYGTYENGMAQLPDYLNDLNAMHEVEKILIRPNLYAKGGWGTYLHNLSIVTDEQHPIDATAAQRAEAFLLAIGKWTANQNEL